MAEIILSVPKEHHDQFIDSVTEVGLIATESQGSTTSPNAYVKIHYVYPNELYYLGLKFATKVSEFLVTKG